MLLYTVKQKINRDQRIVLQMLTRLCQFFSFLNDTFTTERQIKKCVNERAGNTNKYRSHVLCEWQSEFIL